MAERTLIAGCGYVGSQLAAQLSAAGHDVTALRRSTPAGGASGPSGVRWLRGDLADRGALERCLGEGLSDGVDVVFFSAAASSHDEAGYRAIYVDGQRNLIAALSANGAAPRRYLFTSSTGVYGHSDGSVVDERSPTEPTAFSGRVMCEAEAVVADAPWPSIALRLGGIYGPQRTRLIESVRSGAATLSAATLYTNRIHRDDCAGALSHLMNVELAGRHDVYNGVDAEAAPRAEVLAFIAELVGVDAPQPSGEASARARGGNKRVSSERLQSSGYALRYPTYREGYRALLAAMNGTDDDA